MLLQLIVTLGLTIIFTETPAIHCGNELANGCLIRPDNIIYISYYSDDPNRTLHHEIGHKLFDDDKTIKIIIKDYPELRDHSNSKNYNIDDEKVADYYAQYKLNNLWFSVRYPSLYIYFRDKLNKL